MKDGEIGEDMRVGLQRPFVTAAQSILGPLDLPPNVSRRRGGTFGEAQAADACCG